MNDRQENKFTMYKAVSDLLDVNTTKTAAMSAFATALTNFKNLMTGISEKNVLKNSATVGKTALKNQQQTELINTTVQIASALVALGNATNDPRLKELDQIKKGYLSNLRDTELSDKVAQVQTAANANAVPLNAYGVGAPDIASFSAKAAVYSSALGGKETSFATKTATTQVMSDLFKQADVILEGQLDTMMEKFKSSDSQFYLEYKSAREIKDLGHRFDPPADPTPPTP